MNQMSLVPPPPIDVDIKACVKLQNALNHSSFKADKGMCIGPGETLEEEITFTLRTKMCAYY